LNNKQNVHAALLLAGAVQRLYPKAKRGMYGAIEAGFYYDFDFGEESPPSLHDLAAIQVEMLVLAKCSQPIARVKVPRMQAIAMFEEKGERWKAEQLRDLPGESQVLVRQGDRLDLAPEGEAGEDSVESAESADRVDSAASVDNMNSMESAESADRVDRVDSAASVAVIGAGAVQKSGAPFFKLLNIAGAYWRGDSNNAVLQRIYGVAFGSAAELDDYLAWQEEARNRDHRKLGKQLELFMFSEEAPGMPFYLPKGTVLRNELEGLAREKLAEFRYEEVRTPFIMNRGMWGQSGHFDHYRDNMYFSELDGQHVAVKPMNCPGHMLMFKNKRHSYKELPIRYAEFGQVHRYEYSGALNGLFRVRTFCQDDAHIFAAPGQVEEELQGTIGLIQSVYDLFGFSYSLELSTRPEQSMGSDEQWNLAEEALRRVLERAGLPYSLNPGDGAFYGPKIDFHIRDALGRSHQCGTIQLDFQMPEKFGLSYIDEHNEKQTPIVIHRAVYGSIDRFLGILIEHYAGAFPLWLAPTQVLLLPVAEAHEEYAAELREKLALAGIRAEIDDRREKLGYRIREAQLVKTPFVAVVGDKELKSGGVQVRAFGDKEQRSYEAAAFSAMLTERIGRRS
jgi:threonyl-tRNA synthetase